MVKQGMEFSNIKLLFVLLYFFQIKGTHSQVLVGPKNTAARVNARNVEFNCTIQGTQAIWYGVVSWFVGSRVITNNENFTLSPDFTNLRINNLDPDLAGIYQCADFYYNPNSVQSAKVAAFDPITCPDEMIFDNWETSELSCNATFYLYESNSHEPSMMPTIFMNSTFDNYFLSDVAAMPGNFSVSYNITFTSDWSGQEVWCGIRYEQNPPFYTDSCSFVVYVNHPVTELATDGYSSSPSAPRLAFVDDVINCSSNGYPEPSIVWYNNNDELVSNDYSLLVTTNMVSAPNTVIYKCEASNVVNGQAANATLLVYLTIYSSRNDIAPTGVAVWVIVLAVVLPILIIAAVIIIVLICYKKEKSTDCDSALIPLLCVHG